MSKASMKIAPTPRTARVRRRRLLQVSLMINKIIGGKRRSGPKISATSDTRLQRERFLSVEKLIRSSDGAAGS